MFAKLAVKYKLSFVLRSIQYENGYTNNCFVL